MIKLEDEGLHESGPDADWQESVFLAWRDPSTGIGGDHRIGNELNRGVANMWCGVYTDSGERFRLNDENVPLQRLHDVRGLRCGPQRMFHDGRSLRFALETEQCRVDLAVTDMPSSEHWLDNSGVMLTSQSNHYDIHCTVEGTARIGGRTLTVSGQGWRDHSWGVRRWGQILHHRCLSGNFGERYVFDFFSMLFANGDLIKGGRITENGKREAVANFEFVVAMADDCLTARSATIRGRRSDGREFEVNFALADGVVVQTREYVGIETVGSVRNAAGEQGFGYFALSSNARAGREFPVVALHSVLQNGSSRR
jgi:hypothetical protein